MGKLQVIVGGQFGSEAKGHVAGYLAKRETDLLAIRTGGPNAGHTVYDENGEAFKLRQIPAAAVTNPTAMLAIAAGSEVDPPVLQSEGDLLEKSLPDKLWHRLVVDHQATAMLPSHANAETGLVDRIGSTGKGIGAARADRIMRTAMTWGEYTLQEGWVTDENGPGWDYLRTDPQPAKGNVAGLAGKMLREDGTVQIEAAQGFGLGLHAGFYPYCTSGDCRAIDAMAAVGVNPWDPAVDELDVWVVFRVFPIRVAGNSGPMKEERSWAQLNLGEEYTTVTGKVRRVGMWDQDLADAALEANGWNVNVALMMFDQMFPEAYGATSLDEFGTDERDGVHEFQKRCRGRLAIIGTSPNTLIDLRR